MTEVTPGDDSFVVDEQALAQAFGLTATDVPAQLRAGKITSRSKTGEGADAARLRLTFDHRGQALRLIVDAAGNVITRSRFPVTPPPGS